MGVKGLHVTLPDIFQRAQKKQRELWVKIPFIFRMIIMREQTKKSNFLLESMA
jgi:hypothetical protein